MAGLCAVLNTLGVTCFNNVYLATAGPSQLAIVVTHHPVGRPYAVGCLRKLDACLNDAMFEVGFIAAVDAGRTEDEYLRGCVPLISGIIELTLKTNSLHPLSCDVVSEVLASIDFVKLEKDFIEAGYSAEKE